MSYKTAWASLKHLSEEAHYTEKIKQGRWLWVFDNFNMHHTIQHEHQVKKKLELHSLARFSLISHSLETRLNKSDKQWYHYYLSLTPFRHAQHDDEFDDQDSYSHYTPSSIRLHLGRFGTSETPK